MTTEQEWADDRRRFVADDDTQRLADTQDRSVVVESVHAGAPSGALAEEFASLARRLFEKGTVDEVLREVVHAAVGVVPGVDVASVTLIDVQGRYTTPMQTDPVATRLDELQYQYQEGPCVEAAATPGTGLSFAPSLRGHVPWPSFGPAAAGEGIHAVLATGLFPDNRAPRLGSLNLYSYQDGGLDEASRNIALVLASHASVALASTQAITSAELQSAQLEEALQSRDVIGQAKGILMERRGISAGEAFDVLREISQHLNIKLAALAEKLATHRNEL